MLDLFQKLTGTSEEQLHPKFKLLRDEPSLVGEREILTQLTEGFIDRDNKIVKEFQTTFHSSYWEFYLFQVFKQLGLEIDFTKDRPDFIIDKPSKLLIEAVVSNIKTEGRSESSRNLDDILSMSLPPHLQTDFYELIDEAIVRNSNAILSKSKKYEDKYSDLDWVGDSDPFIIALSSYDQVNYGREYYYAMMALLYGRYFNPETGVFERKECVSKPGTGSLIPIALFNMPEMRHISAIIFSCTTTLGKLTSLSISDEKCNFSLNRVINIRHDNEPPFYKIQDVTVENPEELSDGLFIFHNPNATNHVPKNYFSESNIVDLSCDEKGFSVVAENLPIVSRINMPKLLFHDVIIRDIQMKFNQ